MRTSPRPVLRAAAYGFWRRLLGPAVLAAAVSAAGGAHADDGILTWIVKSISSDEDGDIIQASAMRVPQVGTALVTGQRIATGGGQQMILTNGRDLVEIRPNSTVTIGDDDASTAASNVNLVNGTIHVEVGKRAPGKTFSIDAPYLVATVKGTQFDVTSSSDATAVAVTEGVVAVSADASGASIDVTVGNTAIVGRRNEDRPMLAPTRAGGAPSTIDTDKNIESASATDGSDAGGYSAAIQAAPTRAAPTRSPLAAPIPAAQTPAGRMAARAEASAARSVTQLTPLAARSAARRVPLVAP